MIMFKNYLVKNISTVVNFLLCKICLKYACEYSLPLPLSLYVSKKFRFLKLHIFCVRIIGVRVLYHLNLSNFTVKLLTKNILIQVFFFFLSSSIYTVYLIILTNIVYVFLFWYLGKYFSIIVMIMLDIKLRFTFVFL